MESPTTKSMTLKVVDMTAEPTEELTGLPSLNWLEKGMAMFATVEMFQEMKNLASITSFRSDW